MLYIPELFVTNRILTPFITPQIQSYIILLHNVKYQYVCC